MTKDQILIVTDEFDTHVDFMIITLRELGHEPTRLNSQDIPLSTSMNFMVDAESSSSCIQLTKNGRTIDFSRARSVWWRKPSRYTFLDSMTEQERTFVKEETNQLLYGFWDWHECYWVSRPTAIRAASSKLEQLHRAKRFGFDIPKTIVTTSPDTVRHFYESCRGQMIYKVMTDPFLSISAVTPNIGPFLDLDPEKPILSTKTTRITSAQFGLVDSVVTSPSMFQELVPKKLELRLTVIGTQLFPCAIYSQVHEKTQLDWRDYSVDIPYENIDLPANFVNRCIDFVKSYNLNYSAMDFILTPDERFVFLENNPNGQFMFVEEKVPELKMTSALAQCLINGRDV